MRLVIALLCVAAAALVAASAGLGHVAWHHGDAHNDRSLRVIHYQTNVEFSAQRRMPVK